MEQQQFDVLVVEDDEDFSRLVLISLEARGLTVDLAANLEEATHKLGHHLYKTVSLDAFLGQDNCGPLVKMLKEENHLNHHASLVICSAHAAPEFIKRIEAKGHRAFNKADDLRPYYDYVRSCCGTQDAVNEEEVKSNIDLAIEQNVSAQLEDQIQSMMEGLLSDEGPESDAA